MEGDLVLASDGLPGRSVRRWSKEKIHYLTQYVDIFTTGMKRWDRLVYIDLFSGPGRSVIKGTGEELDGSPLVALKSKHPFTHHYFNDADGGVIEALGQRVVAQGRGPCTIRNLDSSAAAVDAISALSLDAPGTIGLAFVDPTAFQISFAALEEMTRGRRIDLLITVMTGYLRRFIETEAYELPLDSFFGSGNWRELGASKRRGEKLTFRALLDSYKRRLEAIGYPYVDDDISILNSRDRTIYHLVFASKHPRGEEFFRKISQRRFSGQYGLPM